MRTSVIYVLNGGQAESVELQLGITDGSKTEVVSGPIAENDQIIIGMSTSARTTAQTGITNPFQPTRQRIGFR